MKICGKNALGNFSVKIYLYTDHLGHGRHNCLGTIDMKRIIYERKL